MYTHLNAVLDLLAPDGGVYLDAPLTVTDRVMLDGTSATHTVGHVTMIASDSTSTSVTVLVGGADSNNYVVQLTPIDSVAATLAGCYAAKNGSDFHVKCTSLAPSTGVVRFDYMVFWFR